MPFGNLWGLMPYDNSDQLLSPQEALSVQRQGNLGLGAGLLAAAGPSANPISFGQALSSGLMQGQALQNNAVDSMLKRQLVAQEIQKNRLANQQIQNRPNIAAIIHNLPGVSPQQADIITQVFGVDPRAGAEMLDKIPGAISPPTKPDSSETEKKIAAIEQSLGRKLTPAETLAVGGVKPEADSPDQKIAALTKALGRPPTRDEALAILGGGAALKPTDDALDKPLSPADLEKLRDANGQKFPLGTTMRQAQGATTTSQPEIDRKNAETNRQTIARSDQRHGP
jgi:plasmid maintenance system antidote protein VapI